MKEVIKMNCYLCGSKTKVVDSRIRNNRTFRRRKCTSCDERFTTYEINQLVLLDILDKYLPIRLVDEVSVILEKELPEPKNIQILKDKNVVSTSREISRGLKR